jgi:hypothetical protein
MGLEQAEQGSSWEWVKATLSGEKRRSSQGRTADVVVPPLFTTDQIAVLVVVSRAR